MTESAIRFIEPPTPNERIVALEIDGHFTVDDMKAAIEKLQAIVDRGEKALMLVDMKSFDGFELGAMKEKMQHMRMLWSAMDKYAVVGDKRWLEIWTKVADPVTPMRVKHFHSANMDDAWAWLNAPD